MLTNHLLRNFNLVQNLNIIRRQYLGRYDTRFALFFFGMADTENEKR